VISKVSPCVVHWTGCAVVDGPVSLVGRRPGLSRPLALGAVTRLGRCTDKTVFFFPVIEPFPVGRARALSSPIIGGGAPLLGSEALSPSVSVGVSKIGLVPITCQRRRPCSLHSILYLTGQDLAGPQVAG
jgi:hypothetical protein